MNEAEAKIFGTLLIMHISGGMTGLITGLFNMIGKKGGRMHKKLGIIYVSAMFIATLSGTILAFMKQNNFMFLIGIFSFYLAFTGYRTLKNKSDDATRVKYKDVLVAAITALFSVWMIISALIYVNPFRWHFNPVQFIFGIGGCIFSIGDLLLFYGKNTSTHGKHRWIFNHIGRMIGSYISAVTAFLVVNVNSVNPLIIWLGPSVAGSFVIAYYTRLYKRKLKA